MWCTAHALLSNPFEQKPQTATPVLTGSEEKLLSSTGVPGDTVLSGSSAGPALSAAEALRPESGRSASSTGVAAPAAAEPKARALGAPALHAADAGRLDRQPVRRLSCTWGRRIALRCSPALPCSAHQPRAGSSHNKPSKPRRLLSSNRELQRGIVHSVLPAGQLCCCSVPHPLKGSLCPGQHPVADRHVGGGNAVGGGAGGAGPRHHAVRLLGLHLHLPGHCQCVCRRLWPLLVQSSSACSFKNLDLELPLTCGAQLLSNSARRMRSQLSRVAMCIGALTARGGQLSLLASCEKLHASRELRHLVPQVFLALTCLC